MSSSSACLCTSEARISLWFYNLFKKKYTPMKKDQQLPSEAHSTVVPQGILPGIFGGSDTG